MDASGKLMDGGFESGGFTYWSQCGNVNAAVTTSRYHSGTHSEISGYASSPEINGDDGVCQQIAVPAGAKVSFWVYQGTNETNTTYAYQEADLLDSNGYVIDNFYTSASTTNGWVQKTADLSAYGGQTLWLYFGVHGNGWTGGYIYQYVDDVALSTGTPTPTPLPSATPVATATPRPTATPGPTPTPVGTPTPTPRPTSTPTPLPSPTPTPGTWPCNNQQFLTYQQQGAAGTLGGDKEVNVCGTVTQVLPEKTTTSGRHGYFYVQVAAGDTIEIVSNLDAMAQAPSNQPPSVWPWVSVGNYAYVQGRYYYDSNGTQGIDWTEDDTGSWPTVGFDVICDNSGQNCNKYW
jgi:hypothetical protein